MAKSYLESLLAQNENLGFARGNNLAISAASGDSGLIALLNPDAFPEPSAGWRSCSTTLYPM